MYELVFCITLLRRDSFHKLDTEGEVINMPQMMWQALMIPMEDLILCEERMGVGLVNVG